MGSRISQYVHALIGDNLFSPIGYNEEAPDICGKIYALCSRIDNSKGKNVHASIYKALLEARICAQHSAHEDGFNVILWEDFITSVEDAIPRLPDHEALECARLLMCIIHDLDIENRVEKGLLDTLNMRWMDYYIFKTQNIVDKYAHVIRNEVNSVLEENMQGEYYDAHVRDIIGTYL